MLRGISLLGLALTTGMNASPPVVRVIKAARMLDVRSGAYLSPAMILVEGARIKAVGTQLNPPPNSKVLDLGNATLLPGLIDSHTHMLLQLPEHSTADSDLDMAVFSEDTATRALRGGKFAREMLEAGFTSIRDLGNAGMNGDVALRESIRSNWVTGPRMQVSTKILAPVGGQMSRLPVESQGVISTDYRIITGTDEARRAVRQAIYDGADWIKVIGTETGRAFGLGLEEMKAIVDEAHQAHIKVAVHAAGDREAQLAVQAGVDSIEHGWRISHETLDLMAAKRIFFVPTDLPALALADPLTVSGSLRERLMKRSTEWSERLRYAIRVGVPVAAGSDVTQSIHHQNRGQSSLEMLWAYLEEGLTPLQIIRMATISASDLMGWSDQVGSLEPAKYADIIAVNGDPLKDLSTLKQVTFVMKGGDVVVAQGSSGMGP